MELWEDLVEQYRSFAEHARDESPCFEEWAGAVAGDPEVLAWIRQLPRIKQQPNLVFAAARWHGVAAPGPYAGLRRALLDDDGAIRGTILARATQTNEPTRLATLAPVFAALATDAGRPLALLEVGASAGLCLYPDRYRYRFVTASGEEHTWDPSPGRAEQRPRLTTYASGVFRPPSTPLPIAWRGGLDLHPVDLTDPDQVAWLEMLVWPEQDDRRERLAQAVRIARTDPPAVVRGDLRADLPGLLDEAAGHGEVVVFHTAVLAYLEAPEREAFQDRMTELVAAGACHWVSNEGLRVLPRVTASAPGSPGPQTDFVLGVDGRAVAWTHGHGIAAIWF
jgi:hypothetical protein